MSSRELERDIFNRTIQGKIIEVWKLNNKISTLEHKIKSLNKSVEYRKKKAEKNQEKANQIDKIMNLPWVMVDWKIDWSKVAVYYCI